MAAFYTQWLENIQAVNSMLKQLLNGNNELLLILTPNNTDLSLTCHCWVFLRLWRSVIVMF